MLNVLMKSHKLGISTIYVSAKYHVRLSAAYRVAY